MQFVRTLLWLIALVVFVIVTVLNWQTTLSVWIWPELVWDTRLPVIIIAAFLLGLVPTWLLHRGTRWRLNRRISHLEAAARGGAVAARPLDDFGTPSASPAPAPAPMPAAAPPHDVDRPLP